MKNIKTVRIDSIEQFNDLLTNVLTHRIQKSTNQNATSSRSHAVIKIIKEDSSAKNVLLFADLAGFENQEEKEDPRETIFINNSLLELNKVFLSVAKGQTSICTTALTKYFKPHLNGKMVMLYHMRASMINNALCHIKDLVLTIQSKKSESSSAASKIKKTLKTSMVMKPSISSRFQTRIPLKTLNRRENRNLFPRSILKVVDVPPNK